MKKIFKKASLKVTAMIMAVLLLSSGSVLAWDSYDIIWSDVNFITDPLHEDITQLAYARMIMSGVFEDGETDNLLNYNKQGNESYKNIVFYLRQGAYWNDVPTNNLTEFLSAYATRNDNYWITKYKGGYSSAYDVGKHLEQSRPTISKYFMNRYMVRFSHNGRGNFLHSMLGMQANGESYITQQQQKEFEIQWLEVLYKYAQGNSDQLSAEQKHLVTFIDPYEQYEEVNTKAENETDQITADEAESSDGGVIDADVTMTRDQMRLRALGMMCHTIEDSYNPAHTIRKNDSNEILAFGKYENQDWHKEYDHSSKTDKEMREELLSNTESVDALSKINEGYLSASLNNLRTLGLKHAAGNTFELLRKFAKGESWESVKPWLENTVYATDFNEDGSSKIAEGGRRVQKVWPLKTFGDNLQKLLIKSFGESFEKEAKAIPEAIKKYYYDYQKKTTEFYAVGTVDYEEQAKREKEGLEQPKAVIDNLLTILDGAPKKEIIQKWSPDVRKNIVKLAETMNGFIQEFGINRYVDEAILQEYSQKTEDIKSYMNLASTDRIEVSGIVRNINDSGFLLELDEMDDSIWITKNTETNIQADAGDAELKVGQSVKALLSMSENNGKEMDCIYYFNASNVQILGEAVQLMSKGTVKAINNESVVISVDGEAGDYDFVRADGHTSDIKVGDYVDFAYSTDKQLTVKQIKVMEKSELLKMEGTLIEVSGNKISIKVAPEIDGDNGIRTFELENTDIIGTPSVDKNVQIYYTKSKDDGPMNASRIICENHEHQLLYVSNGNGTHKAICAELDFQEVQNCTNENGVCAYCGYKFQAAPTPTPSPAPSPTAKDTSQNTKTGLEAQNGLPVEAVAAGLCILGLSLGVLYILKRK